MNVKVEDISSIRKKLSFEVAAERVDAEIEKAYRKIAKSAKIKGFRAGKIPRPVLEQYYAPLMEEQVLGRLINESYFKALSEHGIPAVSDPEIVESSSLEKGKPFSYEAQVEVKPAVEARDYQGLSLKKEKFVPESDVVEKRLEEMRANRAQMEVSAREAASEGDFVTIDFEGFVDGEPFEGGKAEGYVLELGSGSFIPGFEEQLVGVKRGEEKEVSVTFPEEYGNKELAGKPAVFRVTLHEIKEKVLPTLDDEFAKGFGLESLDELRSHIEEDYLQKEKNRVDGDLRERLVNALVERNPVEVPDAMVESQLDYMLKNVRNRFQSQGMSLEMLGMTDESFRQMYRQTAARQVQGSLVLEAVGRQESIEVEESEIGSKLEQIAEMANAPVESVRKFYERDEARSGLIAQMSEEKVVQFLLDQSIVEEVDKAELEESAPPESKK
ncbi:MAG: trigger factor [Desulfuromonadales bacterium]